MKNARLFLLSIPLLIGLSCSTPSYDSEVILPKIISEGMVFQRGEILKVWGKGIPGRKVRVTLAGVVSSNTVLEDSTWHVELPELTAGGPYVLAVNQVQVNDVYIGDVWLAGGQSNMEWPLKAGVVGAEQEYEQGGFENIRFFKVPNSYSAFPQPDVAGGEWKKATPENMHDFSAVAWFFAKKNRAEKDVPVGIIESNWGGSPAEGWTDLEVLVGLEKSFSEKSQEILSNPDVYEAENVANEKRREIRDILVKGPDSLASFEVSSIGYNDASWRRVNLPSANPLQHIAWVRKSFRLNSTEEVSLTLASIDQQAYVYINGRLLFYKDWGVAMPVLDVPSEWLFKGSNVITVRAANTWNNEPRIGSKDEMYLTVSGQKVSLEGTWAYSNSIVEPQLPKVEWLSFQPGMMYNAMIYPLINYPIKGAIWYQGESNAGRHEEYRELFSAMIQNWRDKWGIGDFPFLFVQLANFMEPQEVQPDSDWAFLREAQDQTLSLPNTGMAVIIDIGEADDIHPRNKKDVGERLWLLAKKVAFEEDVLAEGPRIDTVIQNESTLILTFKSVGEGLKLTQGDQAQAFILGNEKGQFVKAEASILGENQVQIDLEGKAEITEIRYAWADNPAVNLINSAGLPAVPFRFLLSEEK
ncbi:sialate O-acetylesterase [Algoriphagus namhaensis]|uniref:Sialate O-acetylesterase n=1 Tax=Algoriphagus namhaensis TaxID=915353 RepID=A0ABV8AXH3_9BACT